MQAHEKCYLLRLPRELRDYIWCLATLPKDTIVELKFFGFRKVAQPSLARTSHQIRREALSIWYGKTIFDLGLFQIDGNMYNPRIARPEQYLLSINQESRRFMKYAFFDIRQSGNPGDSSDWLIKDAEDTLQRWLYYGQVKMTVIGPSEESTKPRFVQTCIEDLKDRADGRNGVLVHVTFA